MMARQHSSMPRYLKAAVAAKAKGRSLTHILAIAHRSGFDGPPWRLELLMQACVMRAAMNAYVVRKSMDEIHKAVRAVGFRGSEDDVLYLLQQGTDMPRILWGGSAARPAWRPRKHDGQRSATKKSAVPQLYVVRNGKARRLPYPDSRKAADAGATALQSRLKPPRPAQRKAKRHSTAWKLDPKKHMFQIRHKGGIGILSILDRPRQPHVRPCRRQS
jgi:hypothetical protein